MSNTPKISVIMSAYNESFDELSRSINSIINQTYQNIEFIIVSDNPENKDIKTAVQVANDQRIKFIENKENVGLVQSLNRAISEATGIFIARMDADDVSRKTRLKDELQYMQQNSLDIVGSFIEIIDLSVNLLPSRQGMPFFIKVVRLSIDGKPLTFQAAGTVTVRIAEFSGCGCPESGSFICLQQNPFF